MSPIARRHATRPDPAGGLIYFATPTTRSRIELLGVGCGLRADRCTCLPEVAMAAARWNEAYAFDPDAPKRGHAVATV